MPERRQDDSHLPSPKGVQARRSLWTVRQVAEFLGVHRLTVYHWNWEGTGPPSLLIGDRARRYRPEDVEQWIEERKRLTAKVDGR